ncbi:SDR family NAD(P)-dependent oxidoreductase [Alkalihalophilus lindianensis]|uniref:SDR family NAD(P)-dependent oxidoreductase n=1 Tax=Alkalihalophilus lindianensis TaxID=1630542 RepID=A0ABU3X6A3_9BACI|nr:SDR family NAD(P)-dependent oxidoreductase [Alkalihalophilus lindianensis]MDV2682803.1 SDR family NAD(P)-dependent oxidoreductase [Alkalihalophilus lindianensis]
MKKALVLGASGGIGYALVGELVARGIDVIAFSRGKEKLEELYENKSNVTIYPGDALVKEDVLKAADSVDVIFHAVSFPYQEWEKKHFQCMDSLLEVAQIKRAKVALVDNIYAYGKQSTRVTESTKKNPHTKKGKIRYDMEKRMLESEVETLIVHMPDLYGPNANNTILHETLKNVVQNKKTNFVGGLNVAREYLYTSDGAKAMVELSLRSETYNQTWNVPAAHAIAGKDLLAIIREETGYQKSVRTVSTNMVRFMGLFSPFMRELVEMMYLTEQPVLLSGEKYESEVTSLPRTSYKQGIRETISWMRSEE